MLSEVLGKQPSRFTVTFRQAFKLGRFAANPLIEPSTSPGRGIGELRLCLKKFAARVERFIKMRRGFAPGANSRPFARAARGLTAALAVHVGPMSSSSIYRLANAATFDLSTMPSAGSAARTVSAT